MGAVLSTKKATKMGVDEVEVVESCMVAPCQETPRRGMWLSPLDLMLVNRGHTPAVYFYPYRSEPGDFFDVARLKAAMAKALVAFYPLAGRLGMDGNGRAEIDCTGQGALFVVARSGLTIDDFCSFLSSPELRALFVPRVEDHSPSVLCAVQVTFLKCGGVALWTALHHAAVDAISAFHFLQTWSAFSRGGGVAALELPFHDRTLLRARSPPFVRDVTSSESEDLAFVAGQISSAVRRMDDELVRSAIDYFELTEMDSKPAPGRMPDTELRVISWLGMPVYDVDFGWGKPLVMLRAVSERAGFVHLMDSGKGDGSVRVLMCTEAAILNDFQRLLYARF